MDIQGNFKGVNDFCKSCKKTCKQFANVKVVICPLRVEIVPENQAQSMSESSITGVITA